MKVLSIHSLPNLIILSLLILMTSSCRFYRHAQCRKLEKTNTALLVGKYDFGKKDKKYKKQNRKTFCYYKK